jgi:hypothetical protein
MRQTKLVFTKTQYMWYKPRKTKPSLKHPLKLEIHKIFRMKQIHNIYTNLFGKMNINSKKIIMNIQENTLLIDSI